MTSEIKFKEAETRLIIGKREDDINHKPWPIVEVQEACDLIVDCVNKTAPTVDYITPYRMIRTTNIKSGKFDLTNCRYAEADIYERWTRRAKVKAGDVLLTREAPIGEVGYVNGDDTTFLGQRIMQYRANPKVLDSRYLYYSFLSPELRYQFGVHEGSGSVVSHIRVGDCYKFKIQLPSLKEQNIIASILGSFDDKIDLNNQMSKTLEQIAQTLFKRWFIDFEFPDENGNPYKSSGGKMVDSELGEIPEGWKAGKLGDISGEKRKNIKVEDINPEAPYFGLEHIPRKSISLSDWGSASEVSSNKLIFEKNDILFGKIRPYFHKVGVAPIDGVCSTDIIVISPKEDYYSFVLSIVSSEKFVEFATQTSEGTKMPRANWRTLIKYPVVIPDKLTSKRYDEIVLAFVEIIHKNIFECKNLSLIRDSLLPKLMSGKIRVEC